MLYVDAFPYLNIYIYFLLPVILASVYLNFLKHIKSQLCNYDNPGQSNKGEAQKVSQLQFQNLELPIQDGEYAVGKKVTEFD